MVGTDMKINLTDLGEKPGPIHILIGADVLGRLMTVQRKVLSLGLVAIETYLGWTLFSKVPQEENDSSSAMVVTSLFVKEANISDLWELDLIGIKDPIEKSSKEEQKHSVRENFLKPLRKDIMRFISLGGTMTYHYQITSSWLRENCIQQSKSYFLSVYMRTMRRS
ncbi:uncharacterized protein CDAR_119701 [Caerostris darwini]|uniref:Peptidase aspartic putative domain-containing protein n=1 Tax=Caerostris darwini TaxID=1538125 RepID=A0AAV4V4K8_9ARAC|nr:uncharacterized protein CDAR_119701 [Caerostris darwini]